jgi:hypothetical protein
MVLRTQAGFDIPQAFPVGELGEGQAEELVETGKGFDFVVAAIALYTTPEGVHGQVRHELREDKMAGVHGAELPGSGWESEDGRKASPGSSR